MYRQGDVNLIPVSELPKNAKAVKPAGDRVIVRRGEATGHHHSFPADAVELWEADGNTYIEVVAEAMLSHLNGVGAPTREHEPVTVPAGIYLLPDQVEYAPQEIRRVAD